MVLLPKVLKNLVAHSPEEKSVLQSVLSSACAFLSGGQRHVPLNIPSEEARTQFFGLVEALEIYRSIHGTDSPLTSLNESAVAELRKIRDICLQGGTHAYY